MTKKDDTLNVTFVLDQTGSMYPYRAETIIGFNKYLSELKKSQKGELTAFTLVLFNSDNTEVRYAADKLGKVKKLTEDTYIPDGWTPLYDAIGKAIRAQETAIGKKGKAIVVVFTDGEENSSRDWTLESIRKLIEEKQGEKWAFVYLGANQDAWQVGGAMGVDPGSTATYNQTRTMETMSAASAATIMYSQSRGEKITNLIDEDELAKIK